MTQPAQTAQPAQPAWKVGAVARSSGLTVRALHHYDHIGLLTPSQRGEGGHRLYTAADLTRLYRVCLLRGLGFPLDQIARALDDPAWQLTQAIERHLEQTRARAAVANRLCIRLATLAATAPGAPDPDQLFTTLEEMAMLDGTIHSTTTLLVYDDIPAAHAYLVEVFGLTPGELEPGHGEVRAGEHVIWMHSPSTGSASPRTLGGVTSMTVISVDDADSHYARSVAAGAVIIEEPVDQDYGVREYGARDPEGQLWFFHSPLG